MPQSEFDIIKTYFLNQKVKRDDVGLGIGDDAALTSVPDGMQLAVAIDTLVEGIHFPENTSAEDIAFKALAVNLSDLAAMGAEPAWFTLALTLPESNSQWLKSFASGLFSLANKYNMQLIGGDTTRGPLTISIQVAGYVPAGKALKRSGARVGDRVYVTGTLGDAALGLRCIQHHAKYGSEQQAIEKLNRPQPRVNAGMAILDLASACIDISDGLVSDLGHILEASQAGASLNRAAIPLSKAIQQLCADDEANYSLALSGGDDYELCFCASPENEKTLQSVFNQLNIKLTCIGEIEQQTGLRLHHNGTSCALKAQTGYEHFV